MTASTITPIGKYILLKRPADGYSARFHRPGKMPSQACDGGLSQTGSGNSMAQTDRYEDRIGRFSDIESRLARKNQAAQTIRATDLTLQQISSYINYMEDTLDKLVKMYPPYPPGSKERIAELRKVNAFRKQIEQLTFPPPKDENRNIRPVPDMNFSSQTDAPVSITTKDERDIIPILAIVTDQGSVSTRVPELTDDAQDGEIKASIVRLRETGAFIRRQRDELSATASILFRGQELLNDQQVAESKSLFIGKHLGNNPDNDLTTTPSILKGYLN